MDTRNKKMNYSGAKSRFSFHQSEMFRNYTQAFNAEVMIEAFLYKIFKHDENDPIWIRDLQRVLGTCRLMTDL